MELPRRSERIPIMELSTLKDTELFDLLRALAAQERKAAADLLACMAEIERRGAAAKTRYGTLFAYCVEELGLSEETAYRRTRSVRVASRFPETYKLLREGRVNFTTLAIVEPHICRDPGLLRRIDGKNRRQVEKIVAESIVRTDDASVSGKARLAIPDSVRFVAIRPDQGAVDPATPDLFAKLDAKDPQRDDPPAAAVGAYVGAEFRFIASEPFAAAIEKLKAILWHKFPNGRLEDVLFEAVGEFLSRRDPARPRRSVPRKQSQPRTRRPPAAVERQVRVRDGTAAPSSPRTARCARPAVSSSTTSCRGPWAGRPTNRPTCGCFAARTTRPKRGACWARSGSEPGVIQLGLRRRDRLGRPVAPGRRLRGRARVLLPVRSESA